MNKAIAQTITKNAWGNPITNTFDKDTHIQTDFGYTGHKEDTESGLTYAHARYLNTNSKQWLSHDPFSLENFTDEKWLLNPQLQNSYSYAGNDPVGSVDPDGRVPELADASIAAQQIYFDGQESNGVGGGWIYQNSISGGTGMKMGVYVKYQNLYDHEYMLVSRGSRSSGIGGVSDWLVNNSTQWAGLSVDALSAIKKSENFIKEHPATEYTFVGHSKGGAEAAASAIKNNQNAILFNPEKPSVMGNGLYYPEKKYNKSMVNYTVNGEILSSLMCVYKAPYVINKNLPYTDFTKIENGQSFKSVFNTMKSYFGSKVENHLMTTVRSVLKQYEK